jgi:hypothetical protein
MRRGLSKLEFARRLVPHVTEQCPDVDSLLSYVKRWEAGKNSISERYRVACAKALNMDEGELFGFPRMGDRDVSPFRASGQEWPYGGPAFPYPADEDDDEMMRRRAFLLNTAILAGIGAADPVAAVEAARHGLNDAFHSRDDADVSEWSAIAWEYGETYPVTAPADLLRTLLVDLAGLREAFRRYPDDAAQRELYQVSALLSGFLAQTVNNLGHANEARRWWRTARYAAERAGDSFSPLWVRAREVMHATSPLSGRPVTVVSRLIEEAERFASSAPPELVLELLCGKVQMLTIAGREAEAEKGLAQVHERFSATSFAGYNGSLLAWGEERLRNTESFVYARLGDFEQLENAQRAASALYKHDPSNVRWPAANELNKAFCLARGGDVKEGTALARAVVEGLPSPQQAQDIHRRAREVLNAVPEAERDRPVVSEYREWLNSAFSTA